MIYLGVTFLGLILCAVGSALDIDRNRQRTLIEVIQKYETSAATAPSQEVGVDETTRECLDGKQPRELAARTSSAVRPAPFSARAASTL